MRIRKGSQVEVWTQEAASPVGAWRGGEVQWGNGHSYILRWHDGGPDSGRISRKSVRPRPPPAPVPPDLDAGDMVEVFDEEDCLWKCAEVQRAPADGGRQFRVKVVGAPKVLTVVPNRLRVRQVLRDDDVWIVLHKENQIAGAGAVPLRANGNGNGGHYKPVAQGFTPLKPKRSLVCAFDAEAIANYGQRSEDTSNKRLCVYSRKNKRLCVKEVPKVCLNKQDEIDSEDFDVAGTGSNSDDANNQQLQHNDNNDDDDEDSESASSSSDGTSSNSSSSSGGGNRDSRTRSDDAGDREPAPATSRPCDDGQKADLLQQFHQKDHRDGIAVTCGSWGRPRLDNEEAMVQEQIHCLELEAYTALTRAFHASGYALTWEKAELLTDLRAHLHISNDKHLQVINAVANRKGRRYGRPTNF